MSAIFSSLELMSLNENLSKNNIGGLQEIWWHDFVNRTFTYNKNE